MHVCVFVLRRATLSLTHLYITRSTLNCNNECILDGECSFARAFKRQTMATVARMVMMAVVVVVVVGISDIHHKHVPKEDVLLPFFANKAGLVCPWTDYEVLRRTVRTTCLIHCHYPTLTNCVFVIPLGWLSHTELGAHLPLGQPVHLSHCRLGTTCLLLSWKNVQLIAINGHHHHHHHTATSTTHLHSRSHHPVRQDFALSLRRQEAYQNEVESVLLLPHLSYSNSTETRPLVRGVGNLRSLFLPPCFDGFRIHRT